MHKDLGHLHISGFLCWRCWNHHATQSGTPIHEGSWKWDRKCPMGMRNSTFQKTLQFSPPKVPRTRTLFSFFQPSLGLQKVFQDGRIFWQRTITHPNLIFLHQEGWSLYKKRIKKDFLKFLLQTLTKNLTKNMVWRLEHDFQLSKSTLHVFRC